MCKHGNLLNECVVIGIKYDSGRRNSFVCFLNNSLILFADVGCVFGIVNMHLYDVFVVVFAVRGGQTASGGVGDARGKTWCKWSFCSIF